MPWIFSALFSVSSFSTVLYFRISLVFCILCLVSAAYITEPGTESRIKRHIQIPYHLYIVVVVVNVIVSSNNHLVIAVIYFATIPAHQGIQNDNIWVSSCGVTRSPALFLTQKFFKRDFPRARCAWNWIYTTGIFPLQKGHSSHWPFSPYGTSSRQTADNPCYRRKTKGPPNSLWLCDKKGVSFRNAKNCSSTPSWTRPSVKYAKDWMDHSFLFPLSCLEKGFTLDMKG